MGASLEGAVAVDVALRHPQRVSALVVGSGATGLGGGPTPEERDVFAAIEKAARAGDVDDVLDLDLRLWVDGLDRGGLAPAGLRERVRAMDRVILKPEAFKRDLLAFLAAVGA